MAKKPGNELFSLVHTLSKPERMHFKKYVRAFAKGENQLFLRLFDLLGKQAEYDDEKVFAGLNKITKTHYAFLKNHLQEILLKCLTDYYTGSTVKTKLTEGIHRVELLIDRNNYRLAGKLHQRIKKLAEAYEYYDYLLILNKLEIKIRLAAVPDAAFINTVQENNARCLRLLGNIMEYDFLCYQPIIMLRHGTIDRDKIKHYLEHPLLASPKKALTFFSLHRYYQTHLLCAVMLGRIDSKIYKKQCEWIARIEKEQDKLVERNDYYIDALSDLMLILASTNRLRESEAPYRKAVAFIESIPAKNKSKQLLSKLSFITINYIGVQSNAGEHKKAIEAWENFRNNKSVFSTDKRAHQVVSIVLFMAHFFLRRYREALKYLNTIIQVKTLVQQDIQQHARFYLLVTHYELGNYELLAYLAKSARRYLESSRRISAADDCILRCFERKLSRITQAKEAKTILLQLKEEVQKNDPSGITLVPAGKFNFMSWLESKIENRPFTVNR